MKGTKRIFAHVQTNKKTARCVFCAISQNEKHFFKHEFDDTTDYYSLTTDQSTDTPAAVAFAAFEDFCKKECSFDSCANCEVILADSYNLYAENFLNYLHYRLGCVDWAMVSSLDFAYACNNSHLEKPLSFKNFRKQHTDGLPEPYATKHLFEEYNRLIRKDEYTPEELDRMEKYIYSHLNSVYRKNLSPRVQFCIADTCAEIYRCNGMRFIRVMNNILSDFKCRKCTSKEARLILILQCALDNIFNDDWMVDGKKPPEEQPAYKIFANLEKDNMQIITDIFPKFI